VTKGTAVGWHGVRYRQDDPATQHVVIPWKEGLPPRRDEPWYLMTGLRRGAVALTDLYGKRMTVEIDLLCIKSAMQMRELRRKAPGLVRKEVWAHILAYNLIRTAMAQAAARHDIPPRSISFTGAMQTLEAFQPLLEFGAAAVAALGGLVGIAGVAYVVLVARRVRSQTAYQAVFEDRLFHVLLPFAAYATLVTSACVAYPYPRPALFLVGAAAPLLLFIGIHNAWDTVTYHLFVRGQEKKDAEHETPLPDTHRNLLWPRGSLPRPWGGARALTHLHSPRPCISSSTAR
jgi:hypothetical protein